MVCDVTNGTTLTFLSSGVKVVPTEVDYRSDKRKYRYARVSLSRRAGEHIDDNADVPEPVRVEVEGRKLARLYLPVDGVTLKHDSADLHLMDPRHSLGAAQVDYVKDSVTFKTVFDKFKDWILHTRKDDLNPNDVITDVRTVAGVNMRERSKSWDTKFDEAVEPFLLTPSAPAAAALLSASEIPIARDIQHFALEMFENMTGMLGEDGGVDWQNISVAAALVDFERTFSVSSWVDEEGVLWFGPREAKSNLFIAGSEDGMFLPTEYNVTKDPVRTTQSWVRGGYMNHTRSGSADATGEPIDDKIRMWGYAALAKPNESKVLLDTKAGWMTTREFKEKTGQSPQDINSEAVGRVKSLTQPPGGEHIVDESQSVNGDVLEKQARRNLLSTIYNENAGSIKINANASGTKSGYPHDIEAADILGVFPPREGGGCRRTADRPTAFGINSVNHTINSREGWTVTLNVGMIPRAPVISYSFDSKLTSEGFTGNIPQEYYIDAEEETQTRSWQDRLDEQTQQYFSNIVDIKTKDALYINE